MSNRDNEEQKEDGIQTVREEVHGEEIHSTDERDSIRHELQMEHGVGNGRVSTAETDEEKHDANANAFFRKLKSHQTPVHLQLSTSDESGLELCGNPELQTSQNKIHPHDLPKNSPEMHVYGTFDSTKPVTGTATTEFSEIHNMIVHRERQKRNSVTTLDSAIGSRSLSLDSWYRRASTSTIIPTQDSDVPDVDHGWAWVVLAATFTSLFTVGFFMVGFAAFYVDLVDRFDSQYGTIGWIGSLQSFTGNFLGVVIGAFVQRFSSRIVGLCGALLGSVGIGVSFFLLDVPYLYITYGLIAGIGNGMCYTAALVIIQHYFDKRRTLANGISTTGIAVGWLLSAPITTALIENYGVSGALLISSGIWLNNLVCASLYRPRKYDSSKSQAKTSVKMDSKKTIFQDLFDFSVLKNVQLDLYLIANFLMYVGAMGYFGHYISWLTRVGLNQDMVVMYQVLMYAVIVISRVAFSVVSNRFDVDRVLIFALVTLCGGAVIAGSSLVRSEVGAILCAVLYGLFAGGLFALQMTVLVDVSGITQISKTTGFVMMVASVARLIGIPITGYLYDVTGFYTLPLIVIGLIHVSAGFVMMTSWILMKYNHGKNDTQNATVT